MKWASVFSDQEIVENAFLEMSEKIAKTIDLKEIDLVFIFVSHQYAPQYRQMLKVAHDYFVSALIIGCSGDGVIETEYEIEEGPGISILAGSLPNIECYPFYLESDMVKLASSFSDIQDIIPTPDDQETNFFLFPDPFTFDTESFLELIDRRVPDGEKVGALASGGDQPGENYLFVGNKIYNSGMVGLALSGNIQIDTIVVQGFRPIGAPTFITKHEHNIITELDGKSVDEFLNDLFDSLDEDDQTAFRESLLIGITPENKSKIFDQNNFLLRNILGFNQNSDGLIIGSHIYPNMVIQFYLEDANSARKELEKKLMEYKDQINFREPIGVLEFSCLGRASSLFGETGFDTNYLFKITGEKPLSGFFGGGEIAKKGNNTYLHGYSTVFVLIHKKIK